MQKGYLKILEKMVQFYSKTSSLAKRQNQLPFSALQITLYEIRQDPKKVFCHCKHYH
jgi:hypothetical protein